MALGGAVEEKEGLKETGSYKIYLTPEAKQDPLFKYFPDEFYAQIGHKDSITQLPESAVKLAHSDLCPVQAFTFLGKKFYATQFHAELNRDDLITRLNYYKSSYIKNSEALQKIINEAKDSPEISCLPELFIDKIVLEK